ncbi:MAG: MarR family transcriptional regulator [Brevundimonas sp.]
MVTLSPGVPALPHRSPQLTTEEDVAPALEVLVSLLSAAQRLSSSFHGLLPVTENRELALTSLTLIAQAGRRGISQSDLARVVRRQPPAITRLVDRLEMVGLVVRSPHPCDRRTKFLHLTDKGRKILAATRELLLDPTFSEAARALSERASAAARLGAV